MSLLSIKARNRAWGKAFIHSHIARRKAHDDVESEIDGVERPFGLTRGLRELLGEGSWKPQPGGTKGEVAYEAAAGWVLVIHVRRLQFTDS